MLLNIRNYTAERSMPVPYIGFTTYINCTKNNKSPPISAGGTETFYTDTAAKSSGTLHSLSPNFREVFLHVKTQFPLFLRRKMWYTVYKNLFWG